jgi:hypothetical protein
MQFRKKAAAIQPPGYYISPRDLGNKNQKCFSFDAPFINDEDIFNLRLNIKPEIFYSRKYVEPNKDKVSIWFHYPNQKLRAFQLVKKDSPIERSKFYQMKIYVSAVEVLRQRNKPATPCIDGKYDELATQHAMKSAKCKHAGISIGNNTPVCTSKMAYRAFKNALYKKENYSPCQGIQFLNIRYEEKTKYLWRKPVKSLILQNNRGIASTET